MGSEHSELFAKLPEVRGGGAQLLADQSDEALITGPAGTGKTVASLVRAFRLAWDHPGSRGMFLRKTRKALTQSVMVSFEANILSRLPEDVKIPFHSTKQQYEFPNGSIIAVQGCDDPEKLKSAEYDWFYANEATELDLDDWEMVGSRLRGRVLPRSIQWGDCNPTYPRHWLKKRCDAGLTRYIESRYEDNPAYWDALRGQWTDLGARYIARLDKLTGARYKRLRLGEWAAAEGAVYVDWDPEKHIVAARELRPEWRRYLSVQFGLNLPFVCQWWAQHPAGPLIRYREIYTTQHLLPDLALRLRELSAGERILTVITPKGAPQRRLLSRLGWPSVPLEIDPGVGIQLVAHRLKADPRLLFVRDSLVAPVEGGPEVDPELLDQRKPTCTEDEPEAYVWARDPSGGWNTDQPALGENRGLEAARLLVGYVDLLGGTAARYAAPLLGARRNRRPYFQTDGGHNGTN